MLVRRDFKSANRIFPPWQYNCAWHPNRHILAVIDLALQQAQHFQAMGLRLDKVREERQQLIVQANKFIPDADAAAQAAS